MIDKKHLLIVANNPSDNTQKLIEACLQGVNHSEIEGVETRYVTPFQAEPRDVLWADAIILGTTENFGYMSGALKDFFDRIYYPCLEKTEALPYALYIRAGLDGTGTKIAVAKITSGLRWKLVQEPIILRGDYKETFENQCKELGTIMAASLDAGII